MGLGAIHTISLAGAREMAAAQRKLLIEGKDPILERDRIRQVSRLADLRRISFDECARLFVQSKQAGWKGASNAQKWTNTLRNYASPFIGTTAVQDIDVAAVLRCLEPIWATKTVTASRVQSRIANILDWATSHDYRTGGNPARWVGHLEHLLAPPKDVAKVKHLPALPYTCVGEFMKKLRALDSVPASALEFTVLTAVRSMETIGATWDEFDLQTRTWTIPAERMKMEREHRVPLAPRVLEILKARALERTCDLVFTACGKKTRMQKDAMADALARMDGYDGITVHGFRSTFRDWISETTAYPRDVAEMALAHSIKNKVEEAYRRGDLFEKRRRLMNDWAAYCATEQNEADNVVALMSKTAV